MLNNQTDWGGSVSSVFFKPKYKPNEIAIYIAAVVVAAYLVIHAPITCVVGLLLATMFALLTNPKKFLAQADAFCKNIEAGLSTFK